MKNKLFAVAFVVILYVLFIMIFNAMDRQGMVSKFFTDIGLSSTSAIASTSIINKGSSTSDINSIKSFRDPMPAPLRKPAPPKQS
jgi:hypothetical protein